MKELLFFVLGMMIGGFAMTTLMACLQINRIKEMETKFFEKENENPEAQNEN